MDISAFSFCCGKPTVGGRFHGQVVLQRRVLACLAAVLSAVGQANTGRWTVEFLGDGSRRKFMLDNDFGLVHGHVE